MVVVEEAASLGEVVDVDGAEEESEEEEDEEEEDDEDKEKGEGGGPVCFLSDPSDPEGSPGGAGSGSPLPSPLEPPSGPYFSVRSSRSPPSPSDSESSVEGSTRMGSTFRSSFSPWAR